MLKRLLLLILISYRCYKVLSTHNLCVQDKINSVGDNNEVPSDAITKAK